MEFTNVAEAVKLYVETRDKLREVQREFKLVEDELKGDIEKIGMFLRDLGDKMGVENFKTPYGTAYKSIKKHYRIVDWEAFATWVKETENFQCLEKRVAKRATAEIHESEGIPPGIEFFEEVEMLVNRAKGT